jgi:hypothetical protein
MQVKYLDRRIRKFSAYTFLIVFILSAFILLFYFTYNNFTLSAYNTILLVFIFLFAILIAVVACVFISVYLVYCRKKANRFTAVFAKAGLKLIISAAIMLAGLFKKDKEAIRSFYIDVNNIIVQCMDKCYKPEDILVVLPHCLQNSECEHKITNNIENCRRCGRCAIGTILEIVGQRGVNAAVVTGGTAARNVVALIKPKMVIAVACERDLESGIHDIRSIPVIGLLNERPFGPCLNTTVNVGMLQSKLDALLCTGHKKETAL